jgi:sugar lactone lactonase YvrE
LRKFVGGELDGLRLDASGRIFVTRNGRGKVAIVAQDGTLVRQITTLDSGPSNLTFGGPDGKTVFVTQTEGGYIEAFQADHPGREFCLQHPGPDCQ